MSKIITITIPEEVRTNIQRADIERSSRRDIITYIMSHNDINVTPERFIEYQKDYDEKYFIFEEEKAKLEREYVYPAANGTVNNWSLDYASCVVTIEINE